MSNVLILDDGTNIANKLRTFLPRDLNIHYSSTFDSAIQRLSTGKYMLILASDAILKINDTNNLRAIKNLDANIRILFFSNSPNPRHIVNLVKSGVDEVFAYPHSFEEYKELVDYTLEVHQSACSFDEENEDDEIFWGKSCIINKIRSKLRLFAYTDDPVLLLGPTGSGKGRAAEFIHKHSAYAKSEMFTVNSAAIAESIADSELFGSVRGAFTGALDQKGILLEADGGILFFDEIGDLSLPLQVKLLRYLETGEIRPIGSTKIKYAKSKIIAATNKNLEMMMKQGLFREDLYYRISNFVVELPSLSAHPEDIEFYIKKILSDLSTNCNRSISITSDAMKLLKTNAYPGNFRQLRAIIKRLFFICQNSEIDLALFNEFGPEFSLP